MALRSANGGGLLAFSAGSGPVAGLPVVVPVAGWEMVQGWDMSNGIPLRSTVSGSVDTWRPRSAGGYENVRGYSFVAGNDSVPIEGEAALNPFFSAAYAENTGHITRDSKAILRAKRTPDALKEANGGTLPANRTWISAYASTSQSFWIEHPVYIEARMKLPWGKGLWPAFWTLCEPATANTCEIDVMEFHGNTGNGGGRTKYSVGIRPSGGSPDTQQWIETGKDLTAGFYTYGMKFTESTIKFYFENVEVASFSTPASYQAAPPMYLILNLAVGGWPGLSDGTTPSPSDMSVDWVRVWKPTTTTTPGDVVPIVVQPSLGRLPILVAENAGTATLAAGVMTWGQNFRQGDVPSGASIKATIGGVDKHVQMDVKNRWSDNSVKFASLATERNSIAAAGTQSVALSTGSVSGGSTISLASAIGSNTLQLALTGDVAQTFQLHTLLASAISGATISYWRQGALVTEGRFEIAIAGKSLRILVDVAAFKAGALRWTIIYANDIAMSAFGGAYTYTATVTMNGVAQPAQTVTHPQYTRWMKVYNTAETDGGTWLENAAGGKLNVQHDAPYLMTTQQLLLYDTGLSKPSRLSGGGSPPYYYDVAIADANWAVPFASDAATPRAGAASKGLGYGMSNTGEHDYIGPYCRPNAMWLIWKDYIAAKTSLGWLWAGQSAPWHYFDKAHGRWLNASDYRYIWTDPRGGVGNAADPDTAGLTQLRPTTLWDWDIGHEPDLFTVPYYLTAERWILDEALANGSMNVVGVSPAERIATVGGVSKSWITVYQTNARQFAWTLRAIVMASHLAPDGDWHQTHFAQVREDTFEFLNETAPALQVQQGQHYGWRWSPNAAAGGWSNPEPWMQDFIVYGSFIAAIHGSSRASQYLDWRSNFDVGRFTAEATYGFDLKAGIAQAYRLTNADGSRAMTWDDIWWNQYVVTPTSEINGNDFWCPASFAYYGRIALGQLTQHALYKGNAHALAALTQLLAERVPDATQANYRLDPAYPLYPGLADNPPALARPTALDNVAPTFLDPVNGAPLIISLAGNFFPPPVNQWSYCTIHAGVGTLTTPRQLRTMSELWRGDVNVFYYNPPWRLPESSPPSGQLDINVGKIARGTTITVLVKLLNQASSTDLENTNAKIEQVRLDGVDISASVGLTVPQLLPRMTHALHGISFTITVP